MCVIVLSAGKNKATFETPDDVALTSDVIVDAVRKNFVVEEGAELPAMTYEDDEGDTINLNLGVKVEFEEALRVMRSTNADTLHFRLVDPLSLRPAEPETPTEALDRLLDGYAEDPKQEEEEEEKANCSAGAAELVSDIISGLDNVGAVCDDNLPDLPELVLLSELPERLPESEADAGQDDSAAALMAHINTAVRGFSTQLTKQLAVAEANVKEQAALAAQSKNEALEATEHASALEVKVAVCEEEVTALRTTVGSLQVELDSKCKAHATELDLLNEQAAKEKQQLQAEMAKREETAKRDASAQIAAVTAQSAEEKQRLVDQVAEQREVAQRKSFEIADLRADTAALKEEHSAALNKISSLADENATLKQELEAVYAKIAGLLPDVRRPAGVGKTLKQAVDTAGAMCVAVKEEVTEAFKGTNNYAAREQPQRPVVRARKGKRVDMKKKPAKKPAKHEVAAAQAKNDSLAAAREVYRKAAASKMEASRRASQRTTEPSAFVKMMDSVCESTLKDLKLEVEDSDASASATATASASATAAASASAAAPVQEDPVDKAYQLLSGMGLDVTRGGVAELMAQHDNNLDRVAERVLAGAR